MSGDGGEKRYVFLDPDGTGSGQGWACVVVAAPTGVVYQNQGAGYSCTQFEQEGYLIPCFGGGLDGRLREIFVDELRGWGVPGRSWSADQLDRLKSAVADFAIYGSAHRDALSPTPLALDESRLPEAAEAWLPVLTPDGPGVLIWENSD